MQANRSDFTPGIVGLLGLILVWAGASMLRARFPVSRCPEYLRERRTCL